MYFKYNLHFYIQAMFDIASLLGIYLALCVLYVSHMCCQQTIPCHCDEVVSLRICKCIIYVAFRNVSYVSLADLSCHCDEGDSLQSSNALSSLYDRVTLDTNSFFYASKYKYRRTKKIHSSDVMSFLFDRLTLEKQMISLMLNAMLKYKKILHQNTKQHTQ